MADRSISELDPAGNIQPGDLFVLQQGVDAKKLSGQQLTNWLTAYADGHGGIQSIAKTETSGLADTYTITFADQSTTTFTVTNGRGISSISWDTSGTAKNGQRHTGTIHYDDGTDSPTFDIYDGLKGNTGAASYLHIRYASQEPTSASHDMSTDPNNWIGLYVDTTQADSTDWQDYHWFKIKGEQGDPGTPSTVLQTTMQYQVSQYGDQIPQTWQNSVPAVSAGEYLWTKVTVTFNSGNPAVWYTVGYNGVNGTGAVSTVNSQNPDGNGNVTITAGNIASVPSTPAATVNTLAKDIQDLRSADSDKQDKISDTGILKGSGNGVVSSATKGTDYGAKTIQITVPTTGWSNGTKTITYSSGDAAYGFFMNSGYAYSVAPVYSSLQAFNASLLFMEDISTDNQITLHCESVPASAITLNVVRMVSA